MVLIKHTEKWKILVVKIQFCGFECNDATYPSYDHCELSLFAMHANVGLIVGHPNGSMMFDRLFTTCRLNENELVKYLNILNTNCSHPRLSCIQSVSCKTRFYTKCTYINNDHHQNRYSLFLSKSSMHLFICAIHSCFSVLVAAYTANDLVVVRISHPLRYSAKPNK